MSHSSWRPECLEDELLVAFFQAKRAIHNAAGGADPGTFPVLHQLAAGGDQRQTQVAGALGLDASTISRHVRGLLRDGLIAASPDPEDRRATLLTLTDQGAASLQEALARRRADLQAGIADFSPAERDEFTRLLHKFAASLSRDN